jgi:thiol-disulfide isomerase/thioredoxin
MLAAALVVAACEQPTEVDVSPELQTGYWRATVQVPGGDIDTGFELSQEDGSWHAYLINGQERVPVDEVRYENRELMLRFPAFNNHIRARLAGGRLIGDLTIIGRYGDTQVMPFSASPGIKRAEPGEVSVDMSGRWAVRFHNEDGGSSASIGEFAQRGPRLFGTFLNPNGDHRFLSGYVRGNQFKLSTFDGAHAFLFAGEIVDDRIDMADFWSGTDLHQTWSARRNANIVLPDAFSTTFLKPGFDRIEFELPSPDGRLLSLADEKFSGKVVIIMIAGTWCPNCNDEARFLAPLYKQYRDRGLEIVALMFEHLEDPQLAMQQIREFRRKFGIEFETLLAGISEKTVASDTLPALNAVLAWPTTIFIDRNGRVRNIHTGFTGPGTGEYYVELQEQLTTLVTDLLDEPVDLLESLAQEQE